MTIFISKSYEIPQEVTTVYTLSTYQGHATFTDFTCLQDLILFICKTK